MVCHQRDFRVSDFAGLATTVTNGSVTAVPEPKSLALLGFISLGAIAVRLRRKRVIVLQS